MRRAFLTNLLLLLALNLLVKPFYILGIDAGVQRAVGAEAYGLYAALLSLGFLLNIVLDLGITNYNTRHIAQHTPLMGKYLGGVAAMRGGLMIAYAAITVCVGIVLGYRGEALGMLGWLVLNQALVASILYLRSNIQGAQRFRQDSLLSVLDRVLLIAGVGWLLWGRAGGEPFRIEWFVWAQTVAYGVTLLVALVLVRRLSGPVRVAWNPAFSWVVMKRSFPYALLILLMTFYYRIDTVMLERLLPDGAVQAGIYYQGFRWFEALNMLGYLVAGLLLPLFSRMLKERIDIAPLAGLAFRLVMAGAIAIAVFGGAWPEQVLGLLYSDHVVESAPVLPLLLWSFVAVCATYVFGSLLTAGGNLRALNWMAAGGALLNIGLNAMLIPRMQAEGAAWAALTAQVLTAGAQVALAMVLHRINGVPGILLRSLAHAVLLLLAIALLRQWESPLALRALAFAPIAVAAAFATGLLRVADLREALSFKGKSGS
ncbi:MAG: oligosaccharide flippase family protein [Flavobacteriales bacterium]|nr:oligosaccharide flippase family protein [Flavobacteriales bacterium]